MHLTFENPYVKRDDVNIFCDECDKEYVNRNPRGYFSCLSCQLDNCFQCATKKADPLVITKSQNNEQVNRFALKICTLAIEKFKNNTFESKSSKYLDLVVYVKTEFEAKYPEKWNCQMGSPDDFGSIMYSSDLIKLVNNEFKFMIYKNK